MKVRLVLASVLALALLSAACTSPGSTPTPGPSASGGVPLVPGGTELAKTGAYYIATGSGSPQVGIWVNGQGAVSATPDVAILYLGIEARAATVAQAQRQQAEAMNRVIAVLKANGVAEKDIRTTSFSINPVTRWIERESRQEIIAYTVTNLVQVKLRKIEDMGKVIDAVAEAGGDLTRINGIAFSVDDPTPLYAQAREKALKDALAKAGQMAEVSGVKLGKPIYITEGASYIPQERAFLGKMEAAGPALTTPISGGELEVTVSVQMAFGIE